MELVWKPQVGFITGVGDRGGSEGGAVLYDGGGAAAVAAHCNNENGKCAVLCECAPIQVIVARSDGQSSGVGWMRMEVADIKNNFARTLIDIRLPFCHANCHKNIALTPTD